MRLAGDFVKRWLVPGTLPFLLVGLTAGVALLYAGPSSAWAGRTWLLILAVLYWTLSLPMVARALTDRLGGGWPRIEDSSRLDKARVLVVLGNGSVHYESAGRSVDYLTRRSVYCAFEAARLYPIFKPDLVIASGGSTGRVPGARPEAALIGELLGRLGVPTERLAIESRSRTTAEQIVAVLELCRSRRVEPPLVVVSTTAHMNRVQEAFAARGVRIIPCVTPDLRYDDGCRGWRCWWPSMSALTGSAAAAYECLASIQARLIRPSAVVPRPADRQNSV